MRQNRATHHFVNGLRVVSILEGRPNHIPYSRPRGVRQKGLTHENKVGRTLRQVFDDVTSGQWFRFLDANGWHCCQIDHYVVLEDQVLLIEAKLTETWVGFSQIDFLYRPVLRHLYGQPVTGVVACRNLVTRRNPLLINDISEALERPGANHVWHCLE